MLGKVCALLGKLESSGRLRGRKASGLIEMVRAFTCPLTLAVVAAALLRMPDETCCVARSQREA